MEADFGGYATKSNVKCTDGRTITPEAFKHMDKVQVPLVWGHMHNSPSSVLGHAILEARDDGLYAHGYFNKTKAAQDANEAIQHGDVTSLSIYANGLLEQNNVVHHGQVREVSLVLAGANPGAKIDFTRIRHSDDYVETSVDEATISFGLELVHATKTLDAPVTPEAPAADPTSDDEPDEGDETPETLEAVLNTLTPKQMDVVNYMLEVACAPDDSNDTPEAEHSDKTEVALTHQEGPVIVTNVFEKDAENKQTGGVIAGGKHFVSHDDMKGIMADAKASNSLKGALSTYMLAHGVTNIEALFPDPKVLGDGTPAMQTRAMAWVQGVIDGTRKNPFSRIKNVVADLTQDEARARGYIEGTYKKSEWFALTTRYTTPTTIFKKQKIDRNDILDITSFNFIAWLMQEMRIMLMEEIAIAILVGDGRDVEDPDHIQDPLAGASGEGLRSILNENELYATQVYVNATAANTNASAIVDEIMMASEFYRGSGSPTFYGTQRNINNMLLSKDANLHRNYADYQALAASMNVGSVVAVEAMNRFPNLIGIVVNLTDYVVGTDTGGEINDFNMFDIDFNQEKYLLETRLSGAIMRPKSALVINMTAGSNVVVVPNAPTFVKSTGIVTIVATTGVVYHDKSTGDVLSTGAQTALAAGVSLTVQAVPTSGYYFTETGTNLVDEWTFTTPRTT